MLDRALKLIGIVALIYVVIFVPMGELTLWQHFQRIWATDEAQEMSREVRDRIRETEGEVRDRVNERVQNVDEAEEEAGIDTANTGTTDPADRAGTTAN